MMGGLRQDEGSRMERQFRVSLARVSLNMLLFVAASPVLAQTVPAAPQPQAAGPGNRDISLMVTVTDKSGQPVFGLTAADFTLLDDKHSSRIVGFHAYTGAAEEADPITTAVVVFDTVNTTFTEVSYARQQVENYLRQNGGHLPIPLAVYWLTNDGVQAQPQATRDGNALAAQLDAADSRLRTIRRSAGVYGAIERFQFSVRLLADLAGDESRKPGRKLLIWAGPGWPMLNAPGLDYSAKTQRVLFGQIVALSTLLREGHIELDSISEGMPDPFTFMYGSFLKGVKKPSEATPSNLSLKVLAVQSGGLVLNPTNDLAASLAACVRDAGAFYILTFQPPPADGPNEYHDLKVKLDKPGLTARTNTGYYNQPSLVGSN